MRHYTDEAAFNGKAEAEPQVGLLRVNRNPHIPTAMPLPKPKSGWGGVGGFVAPSAAQALLVEGSWVCWMACKPFKEKGLHRAQRLLRLHGLTERSEPRWEAYAEGWPFQHTGVVRHGTGIATDALGIALVEPLARIAEAVPCLAQSVCSPPLPRTVPAGFGGVGGGGGIGIG